MTVLRRHDGGTFPLIHAAACGSRLADAVSEPAYCGLTSSRRWSGVFAISTYLIISVVFFIVGLCRTWRRCGISRPGSRRRSTR